MRTLPGCCVSGYASVVLSYLSALRTPPPRSFLLLGPFLGLSLGCGAVLPSDSICDTYTLFEPGVLELSGTPLLSPVEAVVASGEDVLIAGSPTFRVQYKSGEWIPSSDSSIGVVRRADGSVVAVPYPAGVAPGRTSGVRAVTAPQGGGWMVVFAERTIRADSPPGLEFWSGQLSRDLEWSDLHSYTPTGSTSLEPRLASPLAASETEMTFAVPGSSGPGLLILSIRGSTWTASRLEPVSYASFAYDARGDPVGVFVHPDPDAPRDANSVFLYEREEGAWSPTEKLYPGLGAPAHHPALLFHHTLIAGWLVGDPPNQFDVHLMVHLDAPEHRKRFIVANGAASVSGVVWGEDVYALVQHRAVIRQPEKLVLHALGPGEAPAVAASGTDPFLLPPLAAALSPAELLMVGIGRGQLENDPRLPPEFVTTVTVDRSCDR